MKNLKKYYFLCLLLSGLCVSSVSGDESPPSSPASTSPSASAATSPSINTPTLQTEKSPASTNTPKQYIQEDYDVRRFLEEAPPLRKIVYGIDIGTFVDVNEPASVRKNKKGFVCYEGGVQTDSFYALVLGAKPEQEVAGVLNNSVTGCSLDGIYWTANQSKPEGLVFTSNKKDLTSTQSHSGASANKSSARLDRARSLWINGLVPGTLRWIDKNRFEAKAAGSIKVFGTNESEKIILGEIVNNDDLGRPTKLEGTSKNTHF